MTRLLRSFSFRLALLYAGLFGVSVALLTSVSYWVTVAQPLTEARTQVMAEASEMAQIEQEGGIPTIRAALDRRLHTADKRLPFHALIAPDGRVILANLPSWPPVPSPHLSVIEADLFSDGFEADHSALVHDRILADGTRLIIGRDIEDIVEQRELLANAAVYLLGGTLLLGLSGGWLMSRAIGARIDVVSEAARQVMQGDLAERIPVRGSGDDFDRLSETLNLMLSRIQELFEAVRRVSDNVAHELRTPLARLTAQLEAMEHRPEDAAAMRIALDTAIVEATRLNDIFSALIRVSRLEGGRHALNPQRADVVQLLEDVVEFYQPEAEHRGIRLELQAERPILADLDMDLVFQALSNLLDNAIKYAPPGSVVTVSAEATPQQLALAVADRGAGMTPAEQARATERFYRAPGAESRPGEGLGLSVVSAIASAHGASLSLADNAPGLKVSLSFPGAVLAQRSR